MQFRELIDVVIWLLIAVVGLVTAYVTFGVLQSTASGEAHGIAVSGAIAGAIVSWAVLTSVFLQVRSSGGELDRLRRKVEELQQKVIRGAPHPPGFETEIAERHRIVLARPREWEPRGGTILDLGKPLESLQGDDTFPAAFSCYSVPLRGVDITPAKRYSEEIKAAEVAQKEGKVEALTFERFNVGGDASPIESLKVIVRQYAQVKTRISPSTGQPEYLWNVATKDEYFGNIDTTIPSVIPAGASGYISVYGTGLRRGLSATVNGKEREVLVLQSYNCMVQIDESDTAMPGALRITVCNNDIENNRVASLQLQVEERTDSGITFSGLAERPTEEELIRASEELNDPDWNISYREIMRMRVICQHQDLDTLYVFDFADNIKDFHDTSANFNQVLSSIRFLS